MKKSLLFSLLLCTSILLPALVATNVNKNNTFENVSATSEETYPVLPLSEISDVAYFNTNNITKHDDHISLASANHSGVVYGYKGSGNYGYKTSIMSTSSNGSIYFVIADKTASPNTSTYDGYYILWSSNKFSLKKRTGGSDSAALATSNFTLSNNVKYDLELSIIAESETATRIVFNFNGENRINYLDEEDPINPASDSGTLYNIIWTSWKKLNVYLHQYASLPLNVMSSPIAYAGNNSGITINEDSVSIKSSAYSGVTYKYSQSGDYEWTANIHSGSSTNVFYHFVIGDTTDKSETYTDRTYGGFRVLWDNYGTRLRLYSGSTSTLLGSASASVAKDTDYSVKFSLIDLGNDFALVTFKIGNTTKIKYVASNFSLNLSEGNYFYNTIWTQDTVLTVNNSSIEELDTWQTDSLHIGDTEFDGEGHGACKDEGLYVAAKASLLELGISSKTAMLLNENGAYQDTRDRYLAWARACEDSTPFSGTGIVKSESRAFLLNNDSIDYSGIIVVALLSTVMVLTTLLIVHSEKKKRR